MIKRFLPFLCSLVLLLSFSLISVFAETVPVTPQEVWDSNFRDPCQNDSDLTPDKIRSLVVDNLKYQMGSRMFLVQYQYSLLSGGAKYYQQQYRLLMTDDPSADIIYDPDSNTFTLSEGDWVIGTFSINFDIKTNAPVKYMSNGYSSNKAFSFPGNGTNLLLQNDFDVYVRSLSGGQLDTGFTTWKCPFHVDFAFTTDLKVFYDLIKEYDKNNLWLEFYDCMPAIPSFVWKPAKYPNFKEYNTPGQIPTYSQYLFARYLLIEEYDFTYDTLRSQLQINHPYEIRAYCFDPNNQRYEINSFQFSLSEDGFYELITNIDGHDRVTKEYDKNTGFKYTDLDTGEDIDPDTISYNFGYNVSEPNSNVYDGSPDFDFDVDLTADLTQGAGLVRTLFDKLIAKSGLSGFLIALIAISIASWFVFGRRL